MADSDYSLYTLRYNEIIKQLEGSVGVAGWTPLVLNESGEITLTSAHLLVGNSLGIATDTAITGDVTISNAGVTALGSGKVVDANVSATAAIALTKLAALSNSIVPVTNGSGVLASSSTTATELGYVHGVTSAIQTQFNALNPGIAVVATDPVSPTEGQVWYNTTSHVLKYYDGTTVQTVAHV